MIKREIPEEIKVQRALENQGFLVNSAYSRGEKLDMDQLDFEKTSIIGYIFDICDYFGLPFTNNVAWYPDTIEIGEFIGAIKEALDTAGWVSPEEHQRVIEEVRRSAR